MYITHNYLNHTCFRVTNCKSNVEILKAVHNLLSNWAVRLNILESTGTTVEPVLCARRIFLEQAKVNY